MRYEEKLALLEALKGEVAGRPVGNWELQLSAQERADEPDVVEASAPVEEPLVVSEEERKRLFPLSGLYVSKGSVMGRKGMPADFVERMYKAYQDGLSLEEVGWRFGRRTRQSVYEVFRRRGLALRSDLAPRNRRRVELHFQGVDYSPGKDGYLRATSGDRHLLHWRLWEEAHGAIPAGHQIFFRDGNMRNFAVGNLGCESRLAGLERVRPADSGMYLALGRGAGRRALAA